MDELNSIMLGGDAFITKPYNVAILLARIASLLKRACPSGEAEVLEHRGLCLYPESGRMAFEGKQAELTKNEMKILIVPACRKYLPAGRYRGIFMGQPALRG